VRGRVGEGEIGGDVLDHPSRVIWRSSNSSSC
jgi:hypothetical protein